MVVTHDSSLEIKYVAIDELIPYVNNARTHTDEQVKQIASSIKEFGWTNPVLIDGDNGVIAGHGRLLAGQKLGMDKVPTIELQGLSEAQKKAYILADNRLAQNAGWDEDLLKIELQDLESMDFDMSLIGFELAELNKFLKEETEGLTDPDEVPDVEEEATTVKGDVWLLGEHRVMCGDATNETDTAKLMNNKKADMVFTDPPYNVDYNSKNDLLNLYNKGNHVQKDIKNDSFSNDDEYQTFIKKVYDTFAVHLAEYNSLYICGNYESLVQLWKHNKLKISNMLVWLKQNMVIGRMDYQNKHEFILYGWHGRHKWYGDRKQTTVWEFDKPLASKLHPTMKPVELIVYALKNSSQNNQIILDSFLGSGSTLIASEQTNRICYGLELDESYCDVIIKRWQDFTGKQATLENTNKTFEQVQEERNGISIT
tara:strand:- start:76 stop:1353 length:1278 start_codon:yes stop_codon:yes gene_type:complete